ncbi:HD domain-containing phosphohydrolase [Desulforegula conservatrix]|uniref:HD domain-containing phosphohydrolase n=1 Tax=Desulforegula conservatrix TaxID=153026 RepID=UPI0004267EB5|nr:HD domain-containing phosphohydrolase [Desulforegula conservatrix]
MRKIIQFQKTPDILAIDDTPANLQLLAGMLKDRGYRVRPVPNGKLGIQAAKKELPDLILLDINMPGMNGYEVCQHLKSDPELYPIPVIFISAMNDTLDKVKAFSVGAVDYITKPFQMEEVYARVETHLALHFFQAQLEIQNNSLQKLVKDQVREITNSQLATILALSKLAEQRDDSTGKHLERVQILCRMLADRLAFLPQYRTHISECYTENIFHASPMHDIGKVAIPDSILMKPGPLTSEEFDIMKRHTVVGFETLSEVYVLYPGNAFINMGRSIARHHHERWDGKGYPDGLSGTSIPLSARIMSLVDVYDALRSERCYKPPFSHEKAVEIISEGSGTQFDPDIVKAFIDAAEEFRAVRDAMGDHPDLLIMDNS